MALGAERLLVAIGVAAALAKGHNMIDFSGLFHVAALLAFHAQRMVVQVRRTSLDGSTSTQTLDAVVPWNERGRITLHARDGRRR
jgi:hypothetical protein